MDVRNPVLAVILVASLAGGVHGVAAQGTPSTVSPICALAFQTALGSPARSPSGDASPTASPTPTPSGSPSPSPNPSVTSSPAPLSDVTLLDDAIRSCASLEEWEAVAAAYPGRFGEAGARALLIARCADPGAGLGAYATCASLALALASPVPSPTPGPVVSGPPAAEVAPPGDRPERRRRDRPGRRATARVPGATSIRYFSIRGDDPNELIDQASRKAARFCPTHAAACVRYQPGVRARTQTNTRTGECRIVGISTSLRADVFLPRWSAAAGAEPVLVAWWRKMSRRIAAHEAQHIRIAQRALDKLPRRMVGISCSTFDSAYRRWMRSLDRQQAAFDARDRERPLPPY